MASELCPLSNYHGSGQRAQPQQESSLPHPSCFRVLIGNQRTPSAHGILHGFQLVPLATLPAPAVSTCPWEPCGVGPWHLNEEPHKHQPQSINIHLLKTRCSFHFPVWVFSGNLSLDIVFFYLFPGGRSKWKLIGEPHYTQGHAPTVDGRNPAPL